MTDYISKHRENIAQDIESEYRQLRAEMRNWRSSRGAMMRPYYRDLARKTIRVIRAAKSNLASWEARL